MRNVNKELYDFIVSRTHPLLKNRFGFLSINLSEGTALRFFARDDRVAVQFKTKTDNADITIDIHNFDSNEPLERITVHCGEALVLLGDVDKATARPDEINIINFREHESHPSRSDLPAKNMLHMGEASMNLLLLTLKRFMQNNSLSISLSDFGYVVF